MDRVRKRERAKKSSVSERDSSQQVNFRLRQEMFRSFQEALTSLRPEVDQAAFYRYVTSLFIRDEGGWGQESLDFIATLRGFEGSHHVTAAR